MASNNYYYSQHKGAKIDSAINYINDGLPSELNNINNNLDNVTEIAESAVSALGGYGVGGTTAYGESWGYIPIVKTDGGLEIGKYIDFHLTSNDGIDRKARIIISDDDGTPRFTLGGSSSSSTAHLTVKNVTAEQFHGTYYGTLGYPEEITLNGTTYTYDATNTNATQCATGLVFYAPAEAGTEGYLLLADSDGVPTWTNVLPSTTMFKTSSGSSLSLAAFYAAFTSALSSITEKLSSITTPFSFVDDNDYTSLDSGGNPIVDYVANGFYVPTVYRAVGIQLPSNDSAEDNYIMYRFYVFLPDTTGEQGFSVLDSYGNTIYGEINGIYGLVEVTGFCVRSSTDEYYFTSNVLIECS